MVSENGKLIEDIERQAQAYWDFMTQEEREQYAWLAGIIDGEGCIGIHRYRQARGKGTGYQLRLTVGMTSKETIEQIKDLTRIGTISAWQGKPPRKLKYTWTGNEQEAAGILRRCMPFLVTKRQQAILGIRFAQEKHLNRGNFQEQANIRELIHKFNG